MQALVREISTLLHEPAKRLDKRLSSLEYYEKLPVEPSILYSKYVDYNKCEIDPRIIELESEVDGIKWDLGASDGIVFYNGKEVLKRDTRDFRIYPVKDVIGDKLEEYFDRDLVHPSENKIAAFNKAFYSSGALIYVRPDTSFRTPIRLVNLITKSLAARNLIVMGSGSSITLLDEIYSPNSAAQNSFFSNSMEVFLEASSSLKIVSVQTADPGMRLFVNRKASQSRDSSLDWSVAHLGSEYTFGRLEIMLEGEGSYCNDVEVLLGSSKQSVDLTTDLTHHASSSTGSVLVKGVMRDESKVVTKGMIRILPGGKRSQSYLAHHALLLSEKTSATAIPGLEVSTNDVRATHSSSVAQVDEEQIFYLNTRGLERELARKIIALGFLEPAVTKIPNVSLREAIRRLMEDKWDGRSSELNFKPEEVGMLEEEKRRDIFEGHYKYR